MKIQLSEGFSKILCKKCCFFVLAVTYILASLPSCSTLPAVSLSEEEKAMLVPTQEFNPLMKVKMEYVPYEVTRYVYPEEGKIEASEPVPGEGVTKGVFDLVSGSIEDNIAEVGDFTQSIAEYFFVDGKIYEIFTSPDHVTDIRLAPGETISGDAALGNSSSWQMSTAVSSENGRSVTHIYVKPITSELETTMIIPTDQRTYYLRLKSFDNIHMLGVRWKYPEITTFGGSDSAYGGDSNTGISIDVTTLDSSYKISGSNVFWKPTMVFDDGVHTYIQFDPRFNNAAGAPALYMLPTKGSGKSKAEIINYVTRGNMYIADFVIDKKQAWLLMTDKYTVKITRR